MKVLVKDYSRSVDVSKDLHQVKVEVDENVPCSSNISLDNEEDSHFNSDTTTDTGKPSFILNGKFFALIFYPL